MYIVIYCETEEVIFILVLLRYIIFICYLVVDENVATPKMGAEVITGEFTSALLNGDHFNYDADRGYTRHAISDANDTGIIVKLGTPSIINHIHMLLWDKDLRFDDIQIFLIL